MTSLPDFDLADRQASPKPGDILGNCLLTAEIGRGGSGMVFQAYHQGLGVSVAVKVLQLDESRNDPLIHKQLQVEARLLAQLDHPHIVRVLDYENDAPWPYLVLEFVEGPSLSDLIQQSGRLRWDRAVRIVDQVASALEAAQRIGVIHRDVKPGNILLTRSGNAKLADLGLAVIIDEQASRVATRSTARQETLAGTVGYMAPEQALGLPQIDHRADIYGLGCTLYHAITGQLPFRGRTRREVVQKHAHEVPAAPRDLVTELDPALSSLVLKMISKDPKARHASYAELRADLARLPAAAEGDLPPPGEQGAPRQSFWHRLILRLKP
jgi:serine/threonine-protein kinase